MTPYKNPKTGYYEITWTCIEGQCPKHEKPKRHHKSLGTQDFNEALKRMEELDNHLEDTRARVRLGLAARAVTKPTMTLKEFINHYLDKTEGHKEAVTWEGEKHRLNMLIQALGDEKITLAQLTKERLQAWQSIRLRQVSKYTWNSQLATLRSIFNWAVSQGLVAENPFNHVSRVDPGERTVRKYLPPAQLDKAWKQFDDPFWFLVAAFLYGTMCRSKDLRNLKWTDINFTDKEIYFYRTKEKKTRTVAINQTLEMILTEVRNLCGTHEYVFCFDAKGDHVNNGKPLTKDQMTHHLRKFTENNPDGLKLSAHRFRHCAITHALKRGANLKFVQDTAGHRNIQTTEKYIEVDTNNTALAMGANEDFTQTLLKALPQPKKKDPQPNSGS